MRVERIFLLKERTRKKRGNVHVIQEV